MASLEATDGRRVGQRDQPRAARCRPEALGPSTPLYYATGDVESWYDDVVGVRLVAEAWRLAR